MKKLKIKAGKFYRTRDGRKVGIYRTNANHSEDTIHGYTIELNGSEYNRSWTSDGTLFSTRKHGADLIEEWEDPLDFLWDCLPPWHNRYIAMNEDGAWYAYSNEPTQGVLDFYDYDAIIEIPKEYQPKNFTGNWTDSVFKNPKLD